MKYYLLFLIIISACSEKSKSSMNEQSNDLSVKARQEIWDTDVRMSDLAVKNGFNVTLLQFADDSLIKPKEGEFPVIGKKALEIYWEGKEDTKNISWTPFRAEAAKSGDLGYTIGNWKFVTEDSIFYGNYYTFWKRQTDGTWKWVVDGGNNIPSKPLN